MFAFIKYTNCIFLFKKKSEKWGLLYTFLPSRFNAMNRYGIVLMDAGDSGGVLFTDIKYHYFKEMMTTEKRFINFRLDGCHVVLADVTSQNFRNCL